MCHFITATLPAGADAKAFRRLAERAGRVWQPIKKSPALARLRRGETYYVTTPGMCDCGTALGGLAGADMAEQQRKVHRLEKKGWSKAKIGRWVTDRNKSIVRDEIDAWFDLSTTTLSTGATGSVGLMLQFYAASVDDEPFDFDRQDVPIAGIDADFLLKVEEDRLYVFR